MSHRPNRAVNGDVKFTMLRNLSSKKRSTPRALSGVAEPPQTPGVHVYLFWTPDGEQYLSHTAGEVTAEALCTSAAKKVGISPLCFMLYGLFEPQSCCWYSPNHEFVLEENTHLVLHYRMRFYFRNWHGLNMKEPKVSRYSPRSETEPRGSPLLEVSSLEYLFCQAKYDFVNEVIHIEDVKSETELSRFKNESLGMAVLHLSHYAIQTNRKLQETAENLGFHHCIPRSFAKEMSKDNILTQYRMKRIFRNFIKTFQQQTVDKGKLGAQEIMYKYISTLEHLAPHFGTETFSVSHLELQEDGQGSLYPASNHQEESKDHYKAQATHEIMVCGMKGVLWRKVSTKKAQCNPYFRDDKKTKQNCVELPGNSSNTWTSFCDFPEITHITITEDNVHISTDNCCMVRSVLLAL